MKKTEKRLSHLNDRMELKAEGVDLNELISEIRRASRAVPFGNSAFQIAHFTGGEHGPERRARVLLLNMDSKLKSLRECQFRRRRLDLDIEEIREELARVPEGGLRARRLAIDLEEKEASIEDELKLIEDAIIELTVMYREWKSIPPLEARDEFEKGERRYWIRRLADDAQREILTRGSPSEGTLQSLQSVGIAATRDESGRWQLIGPDVALLDSLESRTS